MRTWDEVFAEMELDLSQGKQRQIIFELRRMRQINNSAPWTGYNDPNPYYDYRAPFPKMFQDLLSDENMLQREQE